MKHIASREEMIGTLLQIAYDSNLVGAIQEEYDREKTFSIQHNTKIVHSISDSLTWMLDLTKTQQATLETDFVTQCLKLAQSLMTEKELEISEHNPLELVDHKEYSLEEIEASKDIELKDSFSLKIKHLIIDRLTEENESLKNELHDSNETIYQYASDPKREKLANEIINLKEKNNELKKRQMTPLLRENKKLKEFISNMLEDNERIIFRI